jgi:hypothetical protein
MLNGKQWSTKHYTATEDWATQTTHEQKLRELCQT